MTPPPPRPSPRSWVLACGPGHWASAAAALEPSHIVSLRSPGSDAPDLAAGPGLGRLDLVFNDIVEPRPGLTPPDRGAVQRLLAFADAWDGGAPLLLGCYAGVSRSTAAAYAIACLKTGPGFEAALARALRAASPSATPNALVVALADDLLRRGGAMGDAVRAIGRGADAFEGEPVVWTVGAGRVHSVIAAPSSTPVSQACSTAPSTSPV